MGCIEVRVGSSIKISTNALCGSFDFRKDGGKFGDSREFHCPQPLTGRYLSLQKSCIILSGPAGGIQRSKPISFCEVEVTGRFQDDFRDAR